MKSETVQKYSKTAGFWLNLGPAISYVVRLHPGVIFGDEYLAKLRPISDNTLNGALRRMGYTKDEVTACGFRATFSTSANESGKWHPDAIERALAHVQSNDVRRAYARGEHWDEQVRMAPWWADYLDRAQGSICALKNTAIAVLRLPVPETLHQSGAK